MGSRQQGTRLTEQDMANMEALHQRADPNDREQQDMVAELRAQLNKLQELRKNEDPRLSFSTPEFKEAQRTFTDGFKKNFGRPVEWGLVKEYPWSTAKLVKLEQPVDVTGKPWPADVDGKSPL